MPKRRAFLTISVVILISVLPFNAAFSDSAQVTFSLGPSGTSLLQSGTLLVATRLSNSSDKNAFNVQLESISLDSASLISPTPLPFPVGEIDAGDNSVVQASFDGSNLTARQQYTLTVHGSYRPVNNGTKEDEGHEFTVTTNILLPPAAPGSATAQSTNVPTNEVSGGGFPPVPFPDGFDQANEAGPPVPTGPLVPATPTQNATVAQPDPGDPKVIFKANNPLSLPSGSSVGTTATTAEPSGASNGAGVIFSTANWTAAYSTNGGGSFNNLNPTTIFPNDAVGFCCDQVVQYVPKIDRFIWLLQGPGGYRLASASPAKVSSSSGTAWKYWKLTPALFGLTGGFDAPDMSVGDNYLYLSFDLVGTGFFATSGLVVARVPLAQLNAEPMMLTIEWTDPKNGRPAYFSHLTQNTGNEVFWAGSENTSQIRIFSWAEGSSSYYWRDVDIFSWSNTGLSATTPDGQDFLTGLRDSSINAILGATRAPGPPSTIVESASDGLWFAWSAGTDSNFKQPHVEMVTLDRNNNFKLVQQVQIWDNDYAYAYPALGTNACTGEVGLSLEYGGNGNYENHVVGFWGDSVVYITTTSNVGTTRYGDYVTIRQDPGLGGSFFDAFGYGLNAAPSPPLIGTQTDVRYVLFGRSGACVAPVGSCQPSSSLSVLAQGSNVTSYVPKGNWAYRSATTGVSVVNVEGTSISPTLAPTANAVNSCASNSVTGQTVCTANNSDVYLFSGITLLSSVASSGSGQIGFSGGRCTNCGVAMDAVHNKAVIALSLAGSPGFQYVDLPTVAGGSGGTPSFEPPFSSPAGRISEDPLIDPFQNLLLSANEANDYEIANVANTINPAFFENTGIVSGGALDSSGEDCSTKIALAPAEFSNPSNLYITDLSQATFTPGSPGSWTAPSQVQSLSESSLSAGASGLAVAQGTHTGIVSGEFGGNKITAIALPSTSGSGSPAINDWVTCHIPNDPNGATWSTGDDPHTITAYRSPGSGDAIGLIANGAVGAPVTFLATVDLTKMLNTTIVPRTVGGHGCLTGTLPSSVATFIAVP